MGASDTALRLSGLIHLRSGWIASEWLRPSATVDCEPWLKIPATNYFVPKSTQLFVV